MNIHQAANICSAAAREKLALLEELIPRLTPGEVERYQATINELRQAIETLEATYPQPLGIRVSEMVGIKDQLR